MIIGYFEHKDDNVFLGDILTLNFRLDSIAIVPNKGTAIRNLTIGNRTDRAWACRAWRWLESQQQGRLRISSRSRRTDR